MSRPPRIQYQGAIYHVTQRGTGGGLLFMDDADRERFMLRLGECVEEDGVRLLLFCLMPNHFHLLLETPAANVSMFMHRLQTAYTMYFNCRHGRVGHLVQGRYGAALVHGDRYLLNLSRYVHLNPVATKGMDQKPLGYRLGMLRAYAWSSYRGYAGLANPFSFVDDQPVLAMMEVAPARQRRDYRKFVEAGLAKTREESLGPLPKDQGQCGAESIQRDMASSVGGVKRTQAYRKEAALRHVVGRAEPAWILQQVAKYLGVSQESMTRRGYRNRARSIALMMLTRHGGLDQAAAAEWLHAGSGAAVSQRLSALRTSVQQDPALARQIAELSDRIWDKRSKS